MYVYLFYIFIRLMLLRLCSQDYFISVMKPVTIVIIGIPKEVITLISQLMEKWKTRLEIWSRSEKLTSRWIDISCGFLQGDSYSPVGFCISEIPVCLLLQQSKGYRMGPLGCRDISRTHSLFVDDLKQYQENH